MKKFILACAIIFSTCMSAQTTKTTAVYDTIRIEYENIVKLTQPNEKGSCKAVIQYPDGDRELVNVSKSVRDYILLCEENKIRPLLGLKLRNGVSSSIIKLSKKFTRR